MVLRWSTPSVCRSAAAWFHLLVSSLLLLQTLVSVCGVPSCPRSCSCPGTKEVHCTFRHLTAIPKTFPKGTERLNLGYNSLTEVERSEFRSLRQLEMLMLHGNDIRTIQSGAFYSLRSLQILKLSYNKLTAVNPGLFEGLVGLIRLHLDHNLIGFIEPYSFSGLTSLKLLQLEGNLLKEIHPHTFITVSALGSFWTSGLKHLHLSDNLLEVLPATSLKTAPRLELLTLHGNPWNCDCQLHWLVRWSAAHDGVVKCKRERGTIDVCPQCSFPQHLNGTQLLGLTTDKLTCERPVLRSPLKQWDNPVWAESEAEPDLPYTRDLEKPLGQMTIVLSDSHGNRAHVDCDVRHPGDSSPMTWAASPLSPAEISVNISLMTVLECDIDRETLQNLWQLVAYYYESSAILERGQLRSNTSRATYQYTQVVSEASPYFTELKGHLDAEPSWLLQPRITLKLNRQQTTTKKLAMDFTALITKDINSLRGQDEDAASSWALIRRGATGRVQAALEGSKVHLECSVMTSGSEVKLEWMLPDLSIVEDPTDKIKISERGQLVILNATLSDSGLYYCIVRTRAAVDLMPLRLTIKECSMSPTAFNGQKLLVDKGNSLSLSCEVTSAQPSQTWWYLPKNEILLPTQRTRKAEVMANGTLVVRRMTQEDAGEYSCLVSNLYGVDMLSHIVEVSEEKSSEKSKVKTEREQKILHLDVKEGEGSGGDYQETMGPFATQFPEKVGPPQRKASEFLKRVRIKDSKRKPHKSVKELDPNRWAEMLAKANAKPSVSLPTEPSLEEPSTVTVQRSTSTTPTANPTTVSYLRHFTTPRHSHITKFPLHQKVWAKAPPNNGRKGSQHGVSGRLKDHQPAFPGSTAVTQQHVSERVKVVTVPPNVGVNQPVDENKHVGDGRRNSGFVPGMFNRRRPFYRHRKPPMRKAHPPINPFQQITTPTTTTTTTTTTTAIPILTTASNLAKYEMENEHDKFEDYDYKKGIGLDSTGDLISGPPRNTNLGSTITPFPMVTERDPFIGEQHLPNPKTTYTPKMQSPNLIRAEDLLNVNKYETKTKEVREETAENGSNGRKPVGENSRKQVSTKSKQGKLTVDKVKPKVELVTKSYNTQYKTQVPVHNIEHSPNQVIPIHSRTLSTKNVSTNRTMEEVRQKENKGAPKPTRKPEIHSFPLVEPLHPWLHPIYDRSEQTTSSRITQTNQDRNAGQEGEVNPDRHSQLPRVPPTSHWSARQHLYHHPIFPSWTGQKSISQPRQGPDSYPASTHRPWPFPHLWVHTSLVTNGPEITADTVKPNPTVSGPENFKVIPSTSHHHHHPHQNHRVDIRTQTRDHLFLSRLRNRYRQAQLERIAQLGRIATPKPRSSYYDALAPIKRRPSPPPSYRPHFLRPPAPTGSYHSEHSNAANPSPPPLRGFTPTPLPYYPTTSLAGARWPVGGRLRSQHPTAAPPFPWLLGVGGVKPRITTVNSASVSVLAEDDVFLPCKATGNPEPNVAWTKVSTGATILANTKHGPRFEVLKNGTFMIKNIQLQDRGQYLCTAHNRFGSDRMVITLAVQTEAPRIQPPQSTEIATYLGKNVSFHCLASGRPPAQISWILPDRTFVREAGTMQTPISQMSLLQNGTLKIHPANFSSKGDYKCIASNAAGADTITYHLHVAALPPSIGEEAQEAMTVQQGRSVYAHCSAKGEPVPALKWMIPAGISVKPSQVLGRRLFVFPNGTLLVNNILPADGGKYECHATNAVGIAKRMVQLEVKEDSFSHRPPLPVPPTQHRDTPSRQHIVSAMYGSTVYLHCPESTGSIRGTLWQLPSKTIMEHRYSPERPIKVFHNGTLRILQLTEMDGGNYLCIFQRPNGEDMELFQVDVLMVPPRIEHVRTAQTRITFGENFQVDCVASGLPNPEVSWSLPDGTLVNNALQSDDSGLRSRRYVMFGNGTLLLQQMGKKDEGDYTCHATNKLGKDEKKVRVKVEPNAPQIEKSQSTMTVKLEESAKLSCQAIGEPKPRIVWISPRKDVIQVSSDKYQILEDGTLVINRLTLADEGKYACVARNAAGDDVKNTIVKAEPQEPFIDGVKGKSTTKLLGVSYQTAHLDCKVKGKPEPKVWWITPYGHSLATPYLGGRFQVHQNGSLELRGVRKTDEGIYKCFAKNHLGEASLSVELEVAPLAEKPSFYIPNIEILPIKQDVGQLVLECSARGKPNPEFLWVLPNGTMLTPGLRLQRFFHHFGNGTLRISHPAATDKGIYRCLAKNVAGQAEKRYALEAGRKPVIRGPTGGMKITYGLNLNLPCPVDGWPQPSITWTLPNGVVLDKPQTIGRISFLTNGSLHVRQVANFDKGTYVCKAANSFGSTALTYPVTVMVFPPRITTTMASITRVLQGTPVMLQCVATGIPRPDISWTLPGRTTLLPHNRYTARGGIRMTDEGSLVIQNPVLTNSGIYKCNAKNSLGTDFKSTYLQVI
ncbi:matrix-remodeling-associated protein 5 isoform X2 [Nothobranchius furzeri]|uniref:Transcript variant X2 n=1 Tax=Nothobranchius furzeri TaxID=105023 RepID=A0A9D3BZW5_NOTFU|nr:transcript variant X2 [Nothobranchius furzeri]